MSDVIELEALDQPTFTQVGHWLIFRHDISPTARHLYTVLAAFVHQGRRNTGDTEVWPGHDYRGWTRSSIAEEAAHNPRLQVADGAAYAQLMANLKLPNPKLMDVAVPANRACGQG